MVDGHQHKFNGTLVHGMGRCSCGAWAAWDKRERTYGPVVSEYRRVRLEGQLRNVRDPSLPAPTYEREAARTYEPKTIPDVVDVVNGRRRNPHGG